VLGGGVNGDRASSITRSRLKVAVDIILDGFSKNLILTGSKEEIETMYREAITLGLSPERNYILWNAVAAIRSG